MKCSQKADGDECIEMSAKGLQDVFSYEKETGSRRSADKVGQQSSRLLAVYPPVAPGSRHHGSSGFARSQVFLPDQALARRQRYACSKEAALGSHGSAGAAANSLSMQVTEGPYRVPEYRLELIARQPALLLHTVFSASLSEYPRCTMPEMLIISSVPKSDHFSRGSCLEEVDAVLCHCQGVCNDQALC